MRDRDFRNHIERIKRDAKRYGITDEEMSTASLDGIFGRGKMTNSARIMRIARIAYMRGMMRGVRYVKEAETPITLRSVEGDE